MCNKLNTCHAISDIVIKVNKNFLAKIVSSSTISY